MRLMKCAHRDSPPTVVMALTLTSPEARSRLISGGMHITFARRGYRFGGTLVNNTDISGQIESMNVWYKTLKN